MRQESTGTVRCDRGRRSRRPIGDGRFDRGPECPRSQCNRRGGNGTPHPRPLQGFDDELHLEVSLRGGGDVLPWARATATLDFGAGWGHSTGGRLHHFVDRCVGVARRVLRRAARPPAHRAARPARRPLVLPGHGPRRRRRWPWQWSPDSVACVPRRPLGSSAPPMGLGTLWIPPTRPMKSTSRLVSHGTQRF